MKFDRYGRYVPLLFVGVMVIVIFFFSNMGGGSSKGLSEFVAKKLFFGILKLDKDVINPEAFHGLVRKVAHLVLYFGLGSITYFAIANYTGEIEKSFSKAIAMVAVVSISDEFNQMMISGRTSRLQDIGTDMFGALVGMTLIMIVLLIRDVKSNSQKKRLS